MAGAIIDSTSTHWNTPPELVAAAVQILGWIDLDPCSNDHSLAPATHRCCGVARDDEGKIEVWDDGLFVAWDGQRVFVNPPYGRGIGNWIRKAAISSAAPRLADVLMLIPAAVETKAWTRDVWPNASRVCFPRGRPKFWLGGRPAKQGITKAMALVLFGRKRAAAFDRVCATLGEVVTPRAEWARTSGLPAAMCGMREAA